jgi:hypothetical protein
MATLAYLQPRLRQLKLSGMRDAISARAEEARARQFDPLEFLALLLDDELARREADGVARRIRQARFDEVCDLRDFDWSYNPEIPKGRIWECASGRYIEERSSILFCGPTGVGKSFLAQALGVEACRQLHSVLFVKTNAVLTDLAGGRADGSHQARLRRYLLPRLLILADEVRGTGRMTRFALDTELLTDAAGRPYIACGERDATPFTFYVDVDGRLAVAEVDLGPLIIASSVARYIEADAVLDELMDLQVQWRWILVGEIAADDRRVDERVALPLIAEASDAYIRWWGDDRARLARQVFWADDPPRDRVVG